MRNTILPILPWVLKNVFRLAQKLKCCTCIIDVELFNFILNLH